MPQVLGTDLPYRLQREVLAKYVHRYTCEHVPSWTQKPAPNGQFYAPQYRTDQEWLKHTHFTITKAGELSRKSKYCSSGSPTWPEGLWLDTPYQGAAACLN